MQRLQLIAEFQETLREDIRFRVNFRIIDMHIYIEAQCN
jgi:hypothetical protein